MNKEEIEELKDFTIDLTDIDELALGLEVCSKKLNMVIQEFADTIIQLQQENTKLINQQKEFIEYMNKTIEELECDDVDDEEMKGYLIQRLDIFKEILKKYNEKVTDINVGNIGDEDE